jgi:hypothetical protein
MNPLPRQKDKRKKYKSRDGSTLLCLPSSLCTPRYHRFQIVTTTRILDRQSPLCLLLGARHLRAASERNERGSSPAMIAMWDPRCCSAVKAVLVTVPSRTSSTVSRHCVLLCGSRRSPSIRTCISCVWVTCLSPPRSRGRTGHGQRRMERTSENSPGDIRRQKKKGNIKGTFKLLR